MSNYLPKDDGKTHINIYSKGHTALGRFLSHFSRSPIQTVDGNFESVEGYWYWLGSQHPEKDRLRLLFGFEAKRVGRELRPQKPPIDEVFKQKISEANRFKLINSNFVTEFKTSELPFTHYYILGKGFAKNADDSQWILDFWEALRQELKFAV